MGSWDLPSEHDEEVGERILSVRHFVNGTRVLSTSVRDITLQYYMR